ncbi:hypothetical protein [Streptomyces sp. NPDC056987]|uniref:hypothetical protein n=1 Tax=Streptomyces sp. NPDC056987 TaxID=3345988 RepID=UPI00364425B1
MKDLSLKKFPFGKVFISLGWHYDAGLTTPGGISSHTYLRRALETVGAERNMYASDHPFNTERAGSARRFLDTAPISATDRERIVFRNWEELVAGILR